ncbi:hypothetical protein O6H91_10G081200 [Diphasiastrum complanatum]|uniref:Uncharacterized protein n=1 Tax=Diphasiastrum complanatum TaxID=34168 RepID=A0ACC2CIT5_DIPCM|nr:hypothetical protein O6H91_10G081200 [Diphasiastrum complanatum]
MSDAIVNGLAGAGGGLIAQLITYPLQAVNTRQQTERKGKLQAAWSVTSLQALPSSSSPRGTFPALYQVVNEEGWGGLYRGLKPSLVGTVASQGVYYYFYQVFRNAAEAQASSQKKLGVGDGTVGMFSSLLVAAFAGCVNVLLTNPIWVVVTRMQTAKQAKKSPSKAMLCDELKIPLEEHDTLEKTTITSSTSIDGISIPVDAHGALHTIQDLYREAGIVGFWKGVLPTLIMVSNPSIQFMIYETLLKHMTRKRKLNKHGLKNVSAFEVFLLGAFAKLGATVATYPLLVVKSRLQAKQDTSVDNSLHYTGTLDAIAKMVKYEGLRGFYRGMSTKIVQSVLAAAVLFMIKEELVKLARTIFSKDVKAPRLTNVLASK